MFFRYKHLVIILIFLLQSSYAQLIEVNPVKIHPTSFAIIVDALTYKNCEAALIEYKNAIENDGLSAYIAVDNWQTPDDVKKEILKLYKQKPPLEGAVFVGDVPIPMLRNGQHLTSAFKMDEDRYPWFKSSVPSDRFYDDFDLKFEYLGQDSVHKLSHYYSFLPDSPQKIEREIYTARIKPSGLDINKYEIISNYLIRVAKQKHQKKIISNGFVFTGHGYHSESLAAWADERLSLKEQFPQLFKPGGRIKNLNFAMKDEMKEILLAELQQDDLDFALFHAHGNTDMQLIMAYPSSESINQNIEAAKLFLRSKLRTAQRRNQSLDETKGYYIKQHNVPESWFDGTFGDSLVTADSLLAYKLDIYLDDIRKINPQAKFIMFDECFNGSFHLDEYVAGEYVFGKGNVIVGEANTVNCLQDKWADELLGLLNHGVRLGIRHKEVNILESHLIGDPTFRFASNADTDLNQKLILESENIELWRKLLKSSDDELRSVAVRYLFKNLNGTIEKELTEIYQNDPSINVRLNAIKCLAELNTEAFHEILKISINDPYEYIRRKSAEWMGEVGLIEFLPLLAKQTITDESSRVSFSGKSALTYISSLKAKEECEKFIDSMPDIISKSILKNQLGVFLTRSAQWLEDDIISNILCDTLKLKSRLSEVRTFRNYKFTEALPFLLDQMKNKELPDSVKKYIAESLGWFTFNFNKGKIIQTMDKVLGSPDISMEIKTEALRTKNRLLAGQNNAMLP